MRTSKREFYRVLVGYAGNAGSVVAIGPKDLKYSALADGRPVQRWNPPIFELRGGPPMDYQENDLGWRLCSEKMRRVVEGHSSEEDRVSWLDAVVLSTEGELDYHLLHFEQPLPLDILDRSLSLFDPTNPRIVIKPCLRIASLGRHRVFTYEGAFGPWFVSKEVRDGFVETGCTGTELTLACQV